MTGRMTYIIDSLRLRGKAPRISQRWLIRSRYRVPLRSSVAVDRLERRQRFAVFFEGQAQLAWPLATLAVTCTASGMAASCFWTAEANRKWDRSFVLHPTMAHESGVAGRRETSK